MKQFRLLYLLFILTLAGCMPITPQAAQPGGDRIASAMSGGLMAIAKDATVLDWPSKPGDKPAELRKGGNGWVCRPDDPVTPVNDPRCFNASWLQLSGTEPNAEREGKKRFGLGYMLKGGNAADNFDPAVLTPAEGEHWVIDGPHVMIVSSSDLDPATYSTDHHWGGPYIMFDGAPAEHLMVPTVADVMPSVDDPIRNAMSAAPLRVAEHATIMGMDAAGKMVEVRKGDNGWTCWPDDPTTPTNDPMCGDQQWAEFVSAIAEQRTPQYTGIGIGYMLQGGSSASVSDPTLTTPPEGQDWMIDGPHFMVVAPWKLDPAVYPTDPMSGGPYIMFEGTPYEHLMVPVTEMRH